MVNIFVRVLSFWSFLVDMIARIRGNFCLFWRFWIVSKYLSINIISRYLILIIFVDIKWYLWDFFPWIHKTKLDLRVGSLPKLNFFFFYFILFENDFYVSEVHLFSNFNSTLLICVRSSITMRVFFRPLKLEKKEELIFSKKINLFFFKHSGRNLAVSKYYGF